MTFEPSGDMDTPYVFEQTVVGGAVPKNFFPAVEKGIAPLWSTDKKRVLNTINKRFEVRDTYQGRLNLF